MQTENRHVHAILIEYIGEAINKKQKAVIAAMSDFANESIQNKHYRNFQETITGNFKLTCINLYVMLFKLL